MRTDFRLCRAARFGDLDRVKSLLAAESELVNVKDNEGFLPLHWAARFDHREVAEYLLANGAEVDGRESHEMTPLHIAASSSSEDVAALLIDNGADINALDNNGDAPLDFAAFANYKREGIAATLPPVVHLLREKGAKHGKKWRR
ncbi:MAG: ankyrin repeat domain-containing protein [bacterium]